MSYEIRNDKLLREAYEAGRRAALNEQAGGLAGGGLPEFGFGPWMHFSMWGYGGHIRIKFNNDGTRTVEFRPPHPHYGSSFTGRFTDLYDLLNPQHWGENGTYNGPGSFDPSKFRPDQGGKNPRPGGIDPTWMDSGPAAGPGK